MIRAAAILFSALAVLLAGCGGGGKNALPATPDDAAVVDALADPIMSDPELASQNEAHAAIAVTGPSDSALPPIARDDDAVDAAREEAIRLVGGTLATVPAAKALDLKAYRAALTAAQMAAAAQVPGADCAGRAVYTTRWATALPEPLAVYPRGAVEEAAGSDAGCRLRVVHFRTPVAVAEVLGFYHARLTARHFPVEHGADGDEHLLRGRQGAGGYAVYLRQTEDGLTAADVIVGGI